MTTNINIGYQFIWGGTKYIVTKIPGQIQVQTKELIVIPKILIIEDEKSLLREMETALERGHFDIIKASSGAEASHIIKKKKLDAIIIDISISDTDGWLLCEEIKNNPGVSSLPLIVLYLASERDMAEFKRLGLKYTLDRPDNFSKLADILEKLFPPEEEELKKENIRLLIVEDDSTILNIVTSLFQLEGYKVWSAPHPYRALDILRENNYLIDLIVSDVMMPKMDGISFYLKLQENNITKNIPFIMLTSRDQFEDIKMAYDVGIKDYLSKPFDPLELLKKAEEVLAVHKQKYYREYERDA
jgi:DNA-binding response OmpR family regulator